MIMAICEAIPTVKTIYLCDLDLEKAEQVAKESEGKYGVTIIPTSSICAQNIIDFSVLPFFFAITLPKLSIVTSSQSGSKAFLIAVAVVFSKPDAPLVCVTFIKNSLVVKQTFPFLSDLRIPSP